MRASSPWCFYAQAIGGEERGERGKSREGIERWPKKEERGRSQGR